MVYYIKKPKGWVWDKHSLETLEDAVASGVVGTDWQARRVNDSDVTTVGDLLRQEGKRAQGSEDQVSDAPPHGHGPSPQHQAASAPADPASLASKFVRRYRDAYLVARGITLVGSVVKGIGISLALVIAVVACGIATSGQGNWMIGFGGLLISIVVGVPVYVLGILVSAQGQILKASLDEAVNSSPFLTDSQRAQVMSLT